MNNIHHIGGDSVSILSIADISVQTEIDGGIVSAWIYVHIKNHTTQDQPVIASIVLSKGDAKEKIEVVDDITPFGGVVEAVIRIEEPEFWQPNGSGEQPIYDCMVGISVEGKVMGVAECKFGVRDVRFIEQDNNGNQCLTLYINNQEVFCKGANWVSTSNADETSYRELLQLARDGGFNMIRAKSYENDEFYSICDELGIMVWQDLPADTTASETRSAAKRLRNHPCIVVWCEASGGDEIRQVIAELDPTRPILSELPGKTNEIAPPFAFDVSFSGAPAIESLRDFDEILAEFPDPDKSIALSAISQGEAIRAAIETCRCEKWAISGVLLDALNEATPGINSSLIDYSLRPKPAYYFAKRACAPIMLAFESVENRVRLFATNDMTAGEITGTIQVGVFTFNSCGFDVHDFPVRLEANTSQMIWESGPVSEMLLDPSTQCLVAMLVQDGKMTSKSVYYAASHEEMSLPRPRLLIQRDQISETRHTMTISADAYARCVAISGIPALSRPSDNYFDLLPGEQNEITIENLTVEQANELKVNVWSNI